VENEARKEPSGTTTRLLLLITAVLATGSFIFMLLYLAVPSHRVREAEALRSCFAQEPLVGQPITAEDARLHAEAATRVMQCAAPTTLAQVSWAGYGLVILFGLAAVLYRLHPWWIVRRHRLIPLTAGKSPELVAYLDGLSREAGLPRPPGWLLAPYAGTVGGLAFGRRKLPFVQLDAGLVTRYTTDRPGFRAVLLHELAHVRHRDAGRTYLTIAIWWAFVAVAAVPLFLVGVLAVLYRPNWLTGSWSGSLRVLGALLALVALVYLSRNLFLRAREMNADAFAGGHEPALRRLVSQLPPVPAPRRLPEPVLRLAARLGTHPLPARRLAVIDDPAVLLRPGLGELAGIGITVGVLAANADYVLGLLFRPNALLVRGIIGFLTGLVLAGLLAVALWRAVAGRPARWAWLLPPVALAAGFLVGERLSLLYATVSPADGVGPAAFGARAALLLAAAVLVAGWIWSASHHAVAGSRRTLPAVGAAAGLATAPWFAAWFTFHAVDLDLWTPVWGNLPAVGAGIGWYRTLAEWTGLDWPLLVLLHGNPVTLPGLTLLWLVPVVITFRRGGRVRPALITGVAGGLAVIAAGVALSYAVRSALPLSIRQDTAFTSSTSPFVYVWLTTYVTTALLVQAVVAAIVAAGPHRPRPALVLLAVSVTGTLAAVGWVGVSWFSLCAADLFGTAARPCAPAITITDVSGYLHTILIKGVLVAIPAALLGAALGARRRTGAETPAPQHHPIGRPARVLAATAVVLLAAAVLTTALLQLPRARDTWTAAAAEAPTSTAEVTTIPSTSAAPVPAPVAAGDDACVVGAWTETSNEHRLTLPSGTTVVLAGRGMIRRLRADGTGTDEYAPGYVLTGVVPTGPLKGQRFDVAITGTATFTYRTAGGTMQFSNVTATGTQTTRLNGKVLDNSAFSYTSDPERYTCQGDAMTREASAPGASSTSQLNRTGPAN
jgi:Zn-dependent protease with chaperone function